MNPIKGIPGNLIPSSDFGKGRVDEGPSFGETLKSLYAQVNEQIQEADKKGEEFALGKRQDILETMIASEKADIHFKFLLQIRNKLLDAYHEIMRMNF